MPVRHGLSLERRQACPQRKKRKDGEEGYKSAGGESWWGRAVGMTGPLGRDEYQRGRAVVAAYANS